jgi:hypothetical protein
MWSGIIWFTFSSGLCVENELLGTYCSNPRETWWWLRPYWATGFCLRWTAPTKFQGSREWELWGNLGDKVTSITSCPSWSTWWGGKGSSLPLTWELFVEGRSGRQITVTVYFTHCLLKTALKFQKHSLTINSMFGFIEKNLLPVIIPYISLHPRASLPQTQLRFSRRTESWVDFILTMFYATCLPS